MIATKAEGQAAGRQRALAQVGKASALVKMDKPADAIKLVNEVIDKADAEDVPLMARAYNALGAAERQLGHREAAELAFLHVDVLYSALPDAHAEALANLVELWQQDHKMDHANRAKRTLLDRYPESPWAKKIGK